MRLDIWCRCEYIAKMSALGVCQPGSTCTSRPSSRACVGFLLAGNATTALFVVLSLVVVNVGISSAKAPLWAMPSTFLSGAGAAAGIAMINSLGNLGGFVGPCAIGWLKSVTGGYSAGLYVVAGTLALSAVVTLMLSRQTRLHAGVAKPSHGG
ncbi:hypothetical protein FB597_101218 [Herbaspirillum sp. SJZ099]|nr:hypothetical protein FB597_101218 [Herbaspirillum sp. SJZ099]